MFFLEPNYKIIEQLPNNDLIIKPFPKEYPNFIALLYTHDDLNTKKRAVILLGLPVLYKFPNGDNKSIATFNIAFYK
ncbi:hypothetical protein COMNV_01306 [Commensalibacter sp. Nvir]|nr:hypothetical protein COMNV_01306 [Commensalibacter sp. Nvir]